jgi:hypothetical protein
MTRGDLPLEGVELKLAHDFYTWPLSFFYIAYIASASTSRPSTPSSHERMDHDPLPKFSTS